MEFDINDDPMTYEARPVFGYWTRRQTAVGAVVIGATIGITAVAWALNLPVDIAAFGTFIVGCVGGYFWLSKRHGLYPEQWMPILEAEKDAPQERVWSPPRMRMSETAEEEENLTRKEQRQIKRERKAELETDDLLSEYLKPNELNSTVRGN